MNLSNVGQIILLFENGDSLFVKPKAVVLKRLVRASPNSSYRNVLVAKTLGVRLKVALEVVLAEGNQLGPLTTAKSANAAL